MFSHHRRAVARRVFAWSLTSASVLSLPLFSATAVLAESSSYLAGEVVGTDGKPVPNAAVTLRGQNLSLVQTTRVDGRFTFPTLTVGEYNVSVTKGELTSTATIAVTAGGSEVKMQLTLLKEIGSVSVTVAPYAKRSGTDVTVNAQQLQRLPGAKNLPNILAQLPAAARGSNGQIHINGDHNGINYYVDGVQLPSSLNRVLGSEIDSEQIGFLDAIEGAYPAQYGDRFAAVLDIGTKVGSGPAAGNASLELGSYGAIDTNVGYHAPLAKGGSISVATRFAQTDRGIDPAVAQFVHNRSSDGSQFVRVTLPAYGLDNYNLDVLHSHQTFQIPPDTGSNIPVGTDDDELQDDTFVAMQYHHAIKSHGSFSFGPSFKISHLADSADTQNDLAPGLTPPAPGQTNCTDFTDCPNFSVADDRLAKDFRFNADYDLRSAHHDIKAGALYGTTLVTKNYNITLQPYTALNPVGRYTATDRTPNVAHQQEAYLQDTWKMGDKYIADYGLRADAFQIFSSDFQQGFSQVSPRVKLTRLLGKKASVYVYYGRLFVPFSFENVSPATAAALFTAQNSPGTSFDLKPQRDSLYEVGGHVGLGKGELGVRLSHKKSTDYLDDTQVGATNLHQDINFPDGLVDQEVGYFQQPLPRDGKIYVSVAHSTALNSTNCETQLLQNCAAAGLPGGPLVQSDHDQRWDIGGGLLANDRHHGWYSMNAEYGSGLSIGDTSVCPGGNSVNCKVPPHLVFNAEKGISLTPQTSVAFGMQNVLNDYYALTRNSALQGTHYAMPRTFSVLFRYTQK